MAYQPNIPLPTDLLKNSQADIQANFISNSAAFNQNHVDFNDANAGKHKFLQMPEQSVSPVTAANEMALYTKEQDGVSQMFIRRESDGTEINITNDGLKANPGWARLPNGLIMKWGIVSVSQNTRNTVILPSGGTIPVFTTIFIGTVSQYFISSTGDGSLNNAVCIGDFSDPTRVYIFPRAIGIPFADTISVSYFLIGV